MTYYREHSRKMWHILLRPPLPVYGGSVRWTRCGLNLCEGESTEKRPAENVCKSCERVKERKK